MLPMLDSINVSSRDFALARQKSGVQQTTVNVLDHLRPRNPTVPGVRHTDGRSLRASAESDSYKTSIINRLSPLVRVVALLGSRFLSHTYVLARPILSLEGGPADLI